MKKSIVGVLLVLCVGSLLIGKTMIAKEKEVEQTEQTEPLVIETVQPMTEGVLTIVDGEGGLFYQYQGEIRIINDGKNGQPIEIFITLPDAGCSCFDEKGRLKE